tara:strand:- start:969 stop:2192 length:1224 start_codon:yes stop_codon:yes gene_type:complete
MKTKKILIIIGGGIAAYKSLDLIRLLKKNNFEIKTILTKSGREFVTPLSLTALTGSTPHENMFDTNEEAKIDHISLSRWADLVLVIPTTANFLSKLCQGRAEDLSTTVILASNKDVFLVPAMNVRMWAHIATQQNVKSLKSYGYKFIGPEKGEMACGEYGEGKMSSPRQIYSEIKNYFYNQKILTQRKLTALVTAGPTREYLDPVRYISNESSGKQGVAIANALSRMGIKTKLVLGPSNSQVDKGIKVIKVTSGIEMLNAVKKLLPVDIAVCAAAVSDVKPLNKHKDKLKKSCDQLDNLELSKNSDILEYLGKTNKGKPKLIVGFSAETKDLIKNSKKKIKEKYCDIIIANDVSRRDIGFNSDYNEVHIIDSKGNQKKIPKGKKNYVANLIVENILKKFLVNDKNIN